MQKIIIRQIADYAEGVLTEEEAMDLWAHLLTYSEDQSCWGAI